MGDLTHRPVPPGSDFTDDKRFHLIPQAGVLVTIPPTDDRLVLLPLVPPKGTTGGGGPGAGSEPARGAPGHKEELRP